MFCWLSASGFKDYLFFRFFLFGILLMYSSVWRKKVVKRKKIEPKRLLKMLKWNKKRQQMQEMSLSSMLQYFGAQLKGKNENKTHYYATTINDTYYSWLFYCYFLQFFFVCFIFCINRNAQCLRELYAVKGFIFSMIPMRYFLEKLEKSVRNNYHTRESII